MNGGCHCGQISIRVARRPEFLNPCNCSLCMKAGAAWGYFAADEVSVTGEERRYQRADVALPAITLHFCERCGATTRWTATRPEDAHRTAVNMRLFEPAALAGIEVRYQDARHDPENEPEYRTATIFDGQGAIP